MPLPKRRKDEEKDDFISRCMGDDESVKDFPDPAQRRAVCERQWDEGPPEGAKAMKYPHLLQAVFNSPWAILPETLATIMEIVRFRAGGGLLTAEEIQGRIGSAARPVARQAGSIAVLPLHGPIAQRMNLMTAVSGGTSTEIFGRQFAALMAEPSIKAIVIEVDSPGGSVFGVDELATEIFKARGTKPIIAQVNSMMASAALWIGAAADEVVVTPVGFVGSVGVKMPHIDISGKEEKEGIKTTIISAGPFKDEGSEFEPLSDDARASLQEIVDGVYDRLIASLARSRGVKQATIRNGFGEGRMLAAEAAVEAGMADRVGTLKETLESLGANTDSTRVLLAEADESIGESPRKNSTGLRRRRFSLLAKSCGVINPSAGQNLGRVLNQIIDEQATEDRPRSQIVEEMADAAGISESTVNQILRGEINCPPINVLEGFARVLKVSVKRLTDAAERDGCEYD